MKRTPPRGPRRSLTQARGPAQPQSLGPVRTWGDPAIAKDLARALEVRGAGRDLTHGFHTYPARMHPETARGALVAGGAKPKKVLDPFCGSGTVLVESVRIGATATGVDASPLAKLVADTKLWRGSRRELVEVARAIAEDVVAEGKAARRSGWAAPEKRPARDEALKGMFAPHVRAELEALLARIDTTPDPDLRDRLRALLSSILVKVSRRASDTRAETIDRTVGRGMPARLFAAKAEELARSLDALWREAPSGTPTPRVFLGDARDLPPQVGGFDTIVTSPPYAGTYDYLENQRLRLAFFGMDDKSFARTEIGARRAARGATPLPGWKTDVARVFAEMARVLTPAGRILLLVGDSVVGDGQAARAVRADRWVAEGATSAGLKVVAGAAAPRSILGGHERRVFTERKEEHLILVTP